ncbi:MAG TPA: metalloregulator ArsR/SmtB family transcription factor, partial [Bacteroidales bacterium]|nr:metalloregulator ArsR/SmtB family transcription factor [Bacteroidales bacterium]
KFISEIIKALGNPVRLMIIDELRQDKKCLCELLPKFKLDQSTLSRHISQLKKVGIISEKKEGVRIELSLSTPCILNIFECVFTVVKNDVKAKMKTINKRRK